MRRRSTRRVPAVCDAPSSRLARGITTVLGTAATASSRRRRVFVSRLRRESVDSRVFETSTRGTSCRVLWPLPAGPELV